MKRLALVLVVALALMVAAAAPVFAQGGLEIVIGRDVSIALGSPLRSDLVVVDGDVNVPFGGVAEGDILVVGGNVVSAGTVRGSVLVIGGDVTLRSGSVTEGDVSALGGAVNRESLAIVRGEVRSGWEELGRGAGIPSLPSVGRPWEWRWEGDWLWNAVSGFLSKMLSVLVAVLVVVLFPDRVHKVRQTVRVAPWASLGVGFLAYLVALVLGFLLIIIICLAVLGALVWAAVWAVGMLGLAALGLEVGERLLKGFGARSFAPAVAVLVGSFVLMLLTYLPCCLGGLVYAAIASLAVGAAILSRLGSEPYAPRPLV